MVRRTVILDLTHEEYSRLVNAAGSESAIEEFCLETIMKQVGYVEGMDQQYLDEVEKKSKNETEDVYSA